MIDQMKIDRMMKMRGTTHRYMCEVLQPDGVIQTKTGLSFKGMQRWLQARAVETPQRMIKVTDMTTGEKI